MPEIKIPTTAVPFILYQRTKYLRWAGSIPYRAIHRLLPDLAYRSLVALESRLFARQVMERYAESMRNEYTSLQCWLPERCSAVLDIGCGVAGIDPWLAWHYSSPIEFYLLDKTTTDTRIHYEFQPRASFYNSLSIAAELLTMNGIEPDHIHLLEADEANTVRVKREVDLVISLLAWGFHFPVETYLDQIKTLLSRQGVLILDVSKSSHGVEVLTQHFKRVEPIREAPHFVRIAAFR